MCERVPYAATVAVKQVCLREVNQTEHRLISREKREQWVFLTFPHLKPLDSHCPL